MSWRTRDILNNANHVSSPRVYPYVRFEKEAYRKRSGDKGSTVIDVIGTDIINASFSFMSILMQRSQGNTNLPILFMIRRK